MITALLLILIASIVNFFSFIVQLITSSIASSTSISGFFSNFQTGIIYIFSPLFYFRDYIPVQNILKMLGFIISFWAIYKSIRLALWLFGFLPFVGGASRIELKEKND